MMLSASATITPSTAPIGLFLGTGAYHDGPMIEIPQARACGTCCALNRRNAGKMLSIREKPQLPGSSYILECLSW